METSSFQGGGARSESDKEKTRRVLASLHEEARQIEARLLALGAAHPSSLEKMRLERSKHTLEERISALQNSLFPDIIA